MANKTALGIDKNIEAVLAYSLAFISGVALLILEKNDKFVRFHALQSVLAFLSIFVFIRVLAFIPVLGWVLIPLTMLGSTVLWVVLMVKAYRGEKFKLPYIGDIADRESSK